MGTPKRGPLLRDTLKRMGRAGAGKGGGKGRRVGRKHGVRKFLTKGVHPVPAKAR